MKIDIEVVTGFLGCGKTSFINSLIEESQIEEEKILVIQFEYGEREINKSKDINFPIKLIKLHEVSELKEILQNKINEYEPNRIIIEYNGTSNIEDLFDILKEKKYKKLVFVSTIFFVADCEKINKYISNIGSFIIPFIKCSNMIIMNNLESCSDYQNDESIKKIANINPKAYILKVPNKYELNNELRKSRVLDNGCLRKLKVKIMNLKNV